MDKGAHFYRCDLQVHSPRDEQWTGADCVTDAERDAYAQKLVEACRTQGLQGIAISDHHDMVFVPYVRRAAAAEADASGNALDPTRRLVVFPAMELTLGVPCQALIVFDADFPEAWFSQVLTAMVVTPSAATEAKTAQTKRLAHIDSLKKLKEDLDKHDWLRDRYILFPNVTNEGKNSILRDGFPGKYIEAPCVGGYIDGEVGKLKAGNLSKVSGKDKAWGNKRIACFQTSDNRRENHSDLGNNSTWIKWATPTAEALRQACLAQESRVSQTPPQLPSIVVAEINVSNSAFLGPVDLELNSQYTALIGGRGTGKSTILEYLRWALCDQPPGSADEDTPNYQARRARLIDQTLKPVNGTVQVRFEINQVSHVVRRSADGSLVIKIATGDFRPCTEDEVRTLLPIQAYSQKQLSDVSVRIDELARFITAPIRSDLSRIEREAADRAGRVRQAHATRVRQRALTRTVKNRELEEKSLTEQAAALRASLAGLSAEDQKALDEGKLFEAADRSVAGWQDGITSVSSGISDLAMVVDAHIEGLESPPAQPEAATLAAAQAEYRSFLDDTKAAIDTLSGRGAALNQPLDQLLPTSPWRIWAERLGAVRAAYEDATKRSSAHSERLKQLKDIEDRINKHARETAKVSEELRTLATSETTYETERLAWVGLAVDHASLTKAQCDSLTTTSGGAIRAELKQYADAAEFVHVLRQALQGSRVQSAKIDGLGDHIVRAANPAVQWPAILGDLERLAEFDTDKEGAERRPDAPSLIKAGLSAGDLERVAKALKPSDWLSLSLTPIRSIPVFEYRAREGDYIPFRNASAGQQATALLKTLLNQPGPPLIIDQPEEDLDNPVMLEVVEQVWKAKQHRQLIFASHNANLVVNGDAELVAWCEYRTKGDQSGGKVAGEGAIDMPTVREAIKAIMEGGAAAFNLRKDKYGF
ncbi:MAG: TrlF family AAA-like ATPase [Vicinamibacterales bacterium]